MAEPAVASFYAMGSPCRVVVDHGSYDVASAARELVGQLEHLWSRFLPTSEISALNRSAGQVTVVSTPTFLLVQNAIAAREATRGRFNPLMLTQLQRHGYRNSWTDGSQQPEDASIAPGTQEPIVTYPEISAVRLPTGTQFDPGGIGKGLAIDMAVDMCVGREMGTVSVELGGDLRVHGTPWFGPDWRIPVTNPFDPKTNIATFIPTAGAVTTSTTRKRAWVANGRKYHHLLDPMSGFPADTDILSVTTCSEVAWWAEVAAKTALIDGSVRARSTLAELRTPGALITADGRTVVCDSGAELESGDHE